MSLSLRLRAERKAISEQMRTLLTSTSPNAAEQWRTLDNAQEALRVRIASVEQDSIERDLLNNRSNLDLQRPNIGNEDHRELSAIQQARSTVSYKRDFEKWLHTGERSAEMRALGASGSTLVPQGFQNSLEVKLKTFAGLRQACTILKTDTGNQMPWPREDDVANVGEYLSEGSPTTTADPTFDNVMLTSNLVSSKLVKVSFQLEQDAAFNIADVLLNSFYSRIARATEPTYLTGNGSGQPNGLLPALVAAGNVPVLAVGANANSGSGGDTALTSLGSSDFSNLIDALDPNYRLNASFMANSSAWGKVRRTLDKYGRPLWNTSLQTGDPDKVYSYPYYYNQQMAGIGAGNKSLIFGDFSKYIIRDSAGITLLRYDELFAQNISADTKHLSVPMVSSYKPQPLLCLSTHFPES
jgi:HK97 family phage major capsid protein